MSLREYERKRDFSKTAEPPPKLAKSAAPALRFVIQKHDASRLHYDFRLELDGTLKSWAVPKGVPFERAEKRLAVHVEDHPLDYAEFEGVIPAGQYGGGTVMIWDHGTWACLGGDPRLDLEAGKLHFELHGQKLNGEWTLVRTRGGTGEKENWLLIKSGESTRPISRKRDDESVVSGRTMAKIASARDHEWQSNRAAAKPSFRERLRAKVHAAPAPASAVKSKTAAKKPRSAGRRAPAFVTPMMAKLVEAPPTRGEWIYELKFDGFRALALKSGDHVELLSRNEKSLTRKFPEVAQAVAQLAAGDAVFDGEIVVLDEEGRSSFQLLQQFELGEERPPLCYYVFDFLQHDGRDLRDQPLEERKAQLEELLQGAPDAVRFSAAIGGDPHQLLAEVKARGLEGLIGKQQGSKYESGRRTGAWVKLKCLNEQEFVIGGYTPPQGTRKHFGALLVGYYEGERLKFAGKVGTGFNAALLRALFAQFQELRREDCPFADLPEKRGGRWSQNLTPAEMRRCTWVEPRLICQAKFTEWTGDGKLRHPVFLGLREDKDATAVVREK